VIDKLAHLCVFFAVCGSLIILVGTASIMLVAYPGMYFKQHINYPFGVFFSLCVFVVFLYSCYKIYYFATDVANKITGTNEK